MLSTFLPTPEGMLLPIHGVPRNLVRGSTPTDTTKGASTMQPSPSATTLGGGSIHLSPHLRQHHPPTPPSVPPPPTPDSGPSTPTPLSTSLSDLPPLFHDPTSHYQSPSSLPRRRAYPPLPDSTDKRNSAPPPVAPPPPPPPPRQPPQSPASPASLQTTQDGYALPQVELEIFPILTVFALFSVFPQFSLLRRSHA